MVLVRIPSLVTIQGPMGEKVSEDFQGEIDMVVVFLGPPLRLRGSQRNMDMRYAAGRLRWYQSTISAPDAAHTPWRRIMCPNASFRWPIRKG